MDGETTIKFNDESTFENVCDELKGKIENWQTFYSLLTKETKQEVSEKEIFSNIVETAKEKKKRNVIFLCKPKYTFVVTPKTDETTNPEKDDNNTCVFGYYGDPKYRFEAFLSHIQKHFAYVQEKFDLTYNDNVIDDDMAFDGMIRDVIHENKSKVFVTLTIKL